MGADQGQFTIDGATGALSFGTAPDFETPAVSAWGGPIVMNTEAELRRALARAEGAGVPPVSGPFRRRAGTHRPEARRLVRGARVARLATTNSTLGVDVVPITFALLNLMGITESSVVALGIFVAFVQGFVFFLLSIIYFSGAMEHAH